MSNIFEALEQAQRERKAVEVPVLSSAPQERPHESFPLSEVKVEKDAGCSMETEMIGLYQNIDVMLPDIPQKTIQFIGSQVGEGVSTIVREFARTAAIRLGKKVLILDAAQKNPSQHIHFNIAYECGWVDSLKNGEPADKLCYQAGETNLFLSPISPHPAPLPQVYDHSATTCFLQGLKESYDYILIDSSPISVSPDSVAISRSVDGVILVVEAEKTRWQVVESVKNKILKNGGNILGILFNKRRFYIPDRIYQML